MNFNESDIDTIIDIIEENEDQIEENYNQKEDLLSINSDLRSKIFNSIEGYDKANKELVRYAVKEAFELEDRDIIVIRKDQIIIKLLDDNSIPEVADEDIGTIANRYNGINEEDLKSFYDDIFLQEENEDFFDNIAEVFLKTYLLGKKPDNKTYEQNVFGIIQAIVTNKLISCFDHHEGFFKGFSGYILRIHFKEVFDYISELILVELSKSNGYIMDFLKYYSLRVVILNGVKYDVPEIIDDKGFRWNVASLMPVIKVYIKSAQAYDNLDIKLDYLEDKIFDFYVSDVSPIAYNKAINSEIKNLTQDISESISRMDRYIYTLKDTPNDAQLKNDIIEIREDIHNMRVKKDMLSTKILPRETITRYTDIKKESDTLNRQLMREEKTIERNEQQFVSIKNALTKALTAKKAIANL